MQLELQLEAERSRRKLRSSTICWRQAIDFRKFAGAYAQSSTQDKFIFQH